MLIMAQGMDNYILVISGTQREAGPKKKPQ